MSFSSFFRALALVGVVGLAGCQYLPSVPKVDWSADRVLGVITPYKIEVVQGNVITSEQAEAVKPGMNRAQVRDVLGSPLVADVFHVDRWDYVFTIRRPGAESQSRRVVVLFAGDTFKTSRNAPPLELTPEQLKALPAPAKPAAVTIEPIGATRAYPPLEPNS